MSAASAPENDFLAGLTKGWRAWALLAALAFACAFVGAWRVPVLDRDEARFVQATTQMVETGDYVRIAFQDQDRNKKPVGIHWLQAAAVQLTGAAPERALWAYRLPSALGAVLATLACFWAGLALGSRRAAFIGAALLGSSLVLATEGMIAKTDAMLAGASVLAMAAIAHVRAGGGRKAAFVFWIGLGLGVLIKGPVTPLVAGLCLLTLALWERKAAWMRPLLHWPGPLIALLMILPWLIAVQIATDGAFLREAIGQDLAPKLVGGHERHGGPFGLHTGLLPFLTWPMTFGLLLGMIGMAKDLKGADGEGARARFLLAWIIPTLLMFEILPTKLIHYPLPMHAGLALMCALALDRLDRFAPWQRLTSVSIGVLVGLVVIAAIPLLGDQAFKEADAVGQLAETPLMFAGWGLAGLATLATGVFWSRAHLAAGLCSAVLAGLAFHGTTRGLALPATQGLFMSAETARALDLAGLNPRAPENAGRAVYAVGYSEPSLVVGTRTDLRLAVAALAAANIRMGDIIIVESREHDALSAALLERDIAMHHRGHVEGLNYSNGDPVRIDIAVAGPFVR